MDPRFVANPVNSGPAQPAIAILWNIKSGWSSGDRKAAGVRAILSDLDPQLSFLRVENGKHLLQYARTAVRTGADTIVAAGGDGTLKAVASLLVNTDRRLGVIPAGTLNHFARDLGLSSDELTAARQLCSGHEVQIDVGSVNGRIFLNNSVLGLYPVYRAEREALESRGFGNSMAGRFFAVLTGLLRVFWRVPHLRLRFVTGTDAVTFVSPFVLIANNEHELERGRIGKRTTLQTGKLWVYVMRPSTRGDLLRYFMRYVLGRFSKESAFEVFEVDQLRIETKRKRTRVGLDGEIVRLRGPLEYRSVPKALRVIAPENCPLA